MFSATHTGFDPKRSYAVSKSRSATHSCQIEVTRYRRPGSGRGAWRALSFVFPCQALECSAIHLTASCSVMKPLIASVSPSGHRISTSQPEPGFFRATKAGRCSTILRICAYGGPVQASYPASIKLPSPPRCWSSGCCRAWAKPFRSCAEWGKYGLEEYLEVQAVAGFNAA